ncbi:MAG TPA: cation:proton antiporter [Thermoanaerobaculia bacterium]|nr:cation:proton antiporter [Thermoanaerobaculia bacterium]
MENGADFGPFLLVFAAALLGAKLLGEIAQRLGQPSVLGELVAGAVLGPSVLGLVPLTTSVLLVAEIGVVLLLFEVGLGTDLEELRRVGGSAISVAVVGMALPLLGGFLIVRAAGFSSLVALFAGAALTATSISITARVLSELKVLASREGQIILGAAVADDVLGLVVLAVVTQIVRTGQVDVGVVLRSTGLAIAFLGLALVIGIPVGHRLVGVVGTANVRGVLLASSFGFVMLIAYLAYRAGSAPIVGAFAAGLALARTNRRHDISRALNPVVDIFAPIFFVAIGAQVDVARLNPFDPANRFPLLLALGLTVVGVLGKFAAGFCAWGQVRRAFIGVGMIPRGEVGLIFASIGRQTGGLPQELFVAVVLAVFATTFLTPPLLKLLRLPVLGDRGEAQKP